MSAEVHYVPNAFEIDPRCGKCGAPITTGMMAVFCPHADKCEFWPHDSDADTIEFMWQLRGGKP